MSFATDRRCRSGAALLLLLALGGLDIHCGPGDSDHRALATWQELVARGRWVVPRLTGAWVYQPCEPPAADPPRLRELRCPEGSSPPGDRRPVSSEAENGMRLSGRHASALSRLVRAQVEVDLDQVVTELEDIVQQQSDNAEAHSDLAAAFWLRAHRLDRPSDLSLALEQAGQAVATSEAPAAAWFNYGLASESLFLRGAACDAWQSYLVLDSTSGWAGEAREGLARCGALASWTSWQNQQPQLAAALTKSGDALDLAGLAGRSAAGFRVWLEEELLPAWAKAYQSRHRGRAAQLLDLAASAVTALTASGQDRLLADTVGQLERAEAGESDPAELSLLARAHLLDAEGLKQQQKRHFDSAQRFFREASAAFERASSPFGRQAELGLAYSLFLQKRTGELLPLLDGIELRTAGRAYPGVRGRAQWLRAATLFYLGRPIEALGSYESSSREYEKAGQQDGLASVEARWAELLGWVGRAQEAWPHRFRALALTPWLNDPFYAQYVFGEAGEATELSGWPLAAQAFRSEATAIAESSGDAVQLAVATFHQAADDRQRGDLNAAQGRLTRARAWAEEAGDGTLVRSLDLEIRQFDAELLLSSSPELALSSSRAALSLARDLGYSSVIPALYHIEARCLLALGREAEAERALDGAVAAIEEEWRRTLARRQRGSHEDLWASYFDSRQAPFEALIRLLAQQGRAAASLDIAEKASARELLDLVGDLRSELPGTRAFVAERAEPMASPELSSRLPAGLVLVRFFLLPDRAVVWLVDHQGVRLRTLPQKVTQLWVGDSVRRLRHELVSQAPDGQLREVLGELYEGLIAPWVDEVTQGTTMVLIPDKSLHGLPFAALWDRSRTRYLIEDHPLALAPSATLYVHALERSRQVGRGPVPRALLIANPTFDRKRFPDLSPLPEAIQETQEICRLYPGSRQIDGVAATKKALLDQLGAYEVVHFSGHTVSHPTFPFFVLAPGPDDLAGVLQANELLHVRLDRTAIVVLSSCDSAGGLDIGSPGVSALMRPLLGGGVPAVVGALWKVGEGSSPDLLRHFHRRFATGEEAARALQGAQLELLQGPNRALRSIRYWAAFELVGAARLHVPPRREEPWASR